MQPSENRRASPLSKTKHAIRSSVVLAVLAVAVGGCSSMKSQPDPIRDPAQRLLPRFTEAVTGPAGAMLTNLNGYHCQFAISFATSGNDQLTATGELHSRGGKLCFEPVFKKAKRKGPDTGSFVLIWDVAAGRGFVLSDALQGLAPIGPPSNDTNIFTGTNSAPATDLQVEHAKDLNGLATRIESQDASQPFTLTLSDIKPDLPPPGMFAPPDDFTKYDSEGALLSELVARQRTAMGMDRRDDGELGPYKSEPGTQRPRDSNNPGYSAPGY